MVRKENSSFFEKNLSSHQTFSTWMPKCTLPFRTFLKPRTRSFRRNTNTAKVVSQKKCLGKRKKTNIYLANEGSVLACCSTNLKHFFGSSIGNDFGVMLTRKGPHKPEVAYHIFRIHSLKIYTNLIEYKTVHHTETPLLCSFLFVSKLKVGDIITPGL